MVGTEVSFHLFLGSPSQGEPFFVPPRFGGYDLLIASASSSIRLLRPLLWVVLDRLVLSRIERVVGMPFPSS